MKDFDKRFDQMWKFNTIFIRVVAGLIALIFVAMIVGCVYLFPHIVALIDRLAK